MAGNIKRKFSCSELMTADKNIFSPENRLTHFTRKFHKIQELQKQILAEGLKK